MFTYEVRPETGNVLEELEENTKAKKGKWKAITEMTTESRLAFCSSELVCIKLLRIHPKHILL